jgi:N-hydroxyarylamine O-acetyltransferase
MSSPRAVHLDVDEYLSRIGYAGSREPTPATLEALHRQHLQTVPFENLDVPLGRVITLDPATLWQKIVVNRRGGFCYELNTLFGQLLQALGFPLTFLSARVWTGTGWGPDKDHMALRVDAGSGSWLADVGFGESFVLPLRLEPGLAQDRGLTPFRVVHDGAIWIMEAGDASGDWTPRYRFTLDAHAPHSFAAMCMYQQTSPETTFTRRVVCSRAMEGGRGASASPTIASS